MQRLTDWLETHWVAPAYAGWLLAGIGISFFAAATNTMAGWLYAISGMIFALLLLAAILPKRSLTQLQVSREAIAPVTMGDVLTIDIIVHNPTKQPKTLLQVQDMLPYVVGKPASTAIETIYPQSDFHWVYELPTTRRGVYHWHEVQIRTATPLGLFWCRCSRNVPATAIVYPTVLPLKSCPLIDKLGQSENSPLQSLSNRAQLATEGISRGLRPYRYGDPTRLIHWRTSARYGEFQVRELEVFTGSQEVTICLDSGSKWEETDFEQAAIAAASLYFYASRCQLNVKLWTAATGLVWGNQAVLETLARVSFNEEASAEVPINTPLIWLTNYPEAIANLPSGSAWVSWGSRLPNISKFPGITINSQYPLSTQLQQ
ncbi:DUF58 domain-containing protein [Merismopedia glauca]|uniref:DUF58 domain-containing protein n=1 Tax=Merismopedia glauca CCAP 1448/3 TaxID=1296344 RepID=A0A2T1C955_9CYAN|nr:DUF58 domain-containing protein [Merismopedia glauca]PSB04812.1 DUF58 domain-containing protein [Merismopedia glauca CCAP 1448/3]